MVGWENPAPHKLRKSNQTDKPEFIGLLDPRRGRQQTERVARRVQQHSPTILALHFGHTAYFKVYDVENGAVKIATTINTNGHGHGALAAILKDCAVDTLICGGIGGAKRALAEAGIQLYGGVSGNADQAVNSLLAGELHYDSDAECNHHGAPHGGACPDHNSSCSH